jgi:hypothetical protein
MLVRVSAEEPPDQDRRDEDCPYRDQAEEQGHGQMQSVPAVSQDYHGQPAEQDSDAELRDHKCDRTHRKLISGTPAHGETCDEPEHDRDADHERQRVHCRPAHYAAPAAPSGPISAVLVI